MIDQLVILTYLLMILFIGIYNRSSSQGFKGFATIEGKIKNSKLLLIATIFTSSVGGGTCFGISQKIFSGDFAYGFGLFSTIIVDIFIAIFLVRRIALHYGAETVGDIMHKYYGKVGRILSGIAAIIVSSGFVAAQINVSGHIFCYLLNINHAQGIILSYAIIIIYTTLGGLKSILFTNLLQFFTMVIALPMLSIIGIHNIGFEKLMIGSSTLISAHDNLIFASLAIGLSYGVMNLYPSFIQRVLINQNPQATTKAIYIKSIIYGVFLIFIILNGIISYVISPDALANLALPYLIKEIIPLGFQGFIILGFLSAAMSTADADLHITSVSFVKDILNPIFQISSTKRMLLLARLANIGIGVLTIIIALNFESVIELVIFITGFWGPMLLIPLIFALYNIVLTPASLLFTAFSGVTAFLIWERYLPNYFHLKGVFIGTLFSFCIFLLLNLCKKLNSVNN